MGNAASISSPGNVRGRLIFANNSIDDNVIQIPEKGTTFYLQSSPHSRFSEHFETIIKRQEASHPEWGTFPVARWEHNRHQDDAVSIMTNSGPGVPYNGELVPLNMIAPRTDGNLLANRK